MQRKFFQQHRTPDEVALKDVATIALQERTLLVGLHPLRHRRGEAGQDVAIGHPIIDDDDTREATMGMAEATVIPGHSAIANAVFNASGARVRDLPLTPDKILAALAERS